MGIEPTTSGLDLPLLCRLSYEVGQRKSGVQFLQAFAFADQNPPGSDTFDLSVGPF